jgi:very-short-patch-repair endonuclease
MLPLVRSRLEAARKELLDLGLRNPLINYRYPLSRGVAITRANAATVIAQLVEQDKALSFVPATEEAASSLKLQTAEEAEKLQQRLLTTFYTARTIMEEQGVNTLFLAVGFLHWYESDSSTEIRRAPLLLLPVSLERSNAHDKFKIAYSGEDIGINISLYAKLKAEYGIELPPLPEQEDWDWASYCAAVTAAVKGFKRWQVAPNDIYLDFFSFGRFLLFNDLDSNNWPEDMQPADHAVLRCLLGDGFSEPPPTVSETAFLDDEPATAGLLQAVDADSTQLLAMLAVHEGRNLVIQGPPGTGKSQTITNIIADAVGQGKKVLFVAEKNAALEVVKRRLDALQLGEACLELHSHKANKKELHAELRRTLELGKPALQHLQQQVSLLTQHRNELNAYSKAVNTAIGASGLSAHDVTGRLLQLSEQTSGVALPTIYFADISVWDALRMQKAEALAERIEAGLIGGKPPATYAFWGSGLQALLPRQTVELEEALAIAAQAANTLAKDAAHLAAQTGLPVPESREACLKMAHALELVAGSPDLSGINIGADGWIQKGPQLESLINAGERIAEIRNTHNHVLLPEAWKADIMPIRAALLAHGQKWYRFLLGEYGRAVKQLAAYGAMALPKPVTQKLALTDGILEVQRLEADIAANASLADDFFSDTWRSSSSVLPALRRATSFMIQVHEQIQNGLVPASIINLLGAKDAAANAKKAHVSLLQLLNNHGSAVQAVTAALAFNDHVRFAGSTLLHQPFSVQLPLLQQWKENPAAIGEVIRFNNLISLAAKENLLPLAELAARWQYGKEHLLTALRHTWYHHLLETAITTFEPLKSFSRTAHEKVVEQFGQLDLRNLQFNRAKAALKHWEGLPPAEGGGQMNVLRNEFNKKARHLPIRKLMSVAGLAIQAIKPVFMMSPLSIANFLPPGALDFDLVVFDEASQVRPVEALGAVLRGRQLVVVGDSQQLPPSSFFDTLLEDDLAGEETFTADLPSILGLCNAQGAPQRMLRWHYRSRHESLISLSNQEFYDNRLVVFPSPGTRAGAGLVFHHLPQTVYDRGFTRTNPAEAATVAQCVFDHVRKHPNQSLGVVAFSTAQRDAILNEIENLRRQHPNFEKGLQRERQEPFFVKNLENVQGDERDVIFVSIGYGRTAAGTVSQSFGPLNTAGGEKRLNVLMTRARLRCEVFTNITDEDIDTSKSASNGLRVLKSFLQYARQGRLQVPNDHDITDSPFEDAVAARLIKLGYPVKRKVGSSTFYIDLAIADPENPGRYILGIECDGATYHAARSARDRDRLRQQVLEAMGWRIYRIWSTDWFRDEEEEIKRLIAAIDDAWKKALHTSDDEEEPVLDTAILREQKQPQKTGLEPYRPAQLPEALAEAEMHQHPVGRLAKWVELVVQVESPVHVDELARRMVEAAGITRVGPRVKDHLKLATRFAEGSGAIRQSGSFLYHMANAQPPLRDRSGLPPASRKWKYVAPEEMAGVLYKVVKEAIAIGKDELYPMVVKLLGFARVTEDMRDDILVLIRPMIDAGLLEEEGGVIKIKS